MFSSLDRKRPDLTRSRSETNISHPLPRIATMAYMCYDHLMSQTINQRELRNDSAKVLRDVQAGQTLIVTRNGEPVAELRPIQPRRFASRLALAEAAARAVRIDANRFRANIDAFVDQSIDG